MATFRPAGLSDEDSEDDEYGYFEKPVRYYKPESPNNWKKTELEIQDAIINCNIKEVDHIITNKLNNNVNVRLDSGWTPLMHASFHAQQQIVELLLDKGADPNLHADSVTPVMVVCSNNSAMEDAICTILSNFIDKGCVLNIGDKYGQTPLMRAIGSGRSEVVKKLLEQNVNIEMRDQQGWTALFWAVHHNQNEIMNTLISHGARVTEVDRSNRNVLDIAVSHDYEDIIAVLDKYFNQTEENDSNTFINNQLKSWHDYYPGLNENSPNYASEIPNLLYGMNCENIATVIEKSGMSLRTFLLMEDSDMIELGITMPYQRQRLKIGLRNFHLRGWKLNAVSGLYARKIVNYSALDCLTTLGTHLQQLYLLEATLQYTLRDYERIEEQIKFEPPDSPLLLKMKDFAKKMLTNISTIRREMQTMRNVLTKISRNNPRPADLIKVKSKQDIVLGYVSEAVVVFSIGVIVYNVKALIRMLFTK